MAGRWRLAGGGGGGGGDAGPDPPRQPAANHPHAAGRKKTLLDPLLACAAPRGALRSPRASDSAAAADDDDDDDDDDDNPRGPAVPIVDEDSAGGRSPFPVLGTAGIASSVVNIANTILGSGILAMVRNGDDERRRPGNKKEGQKEIGGGRGKGSEAVSVGLLPGACMVLVSALASGLGLHFLARCAARTHGRSASFNACAQLTFPDAALWFDLAIAIKCFGVGVSYLIIIGDLMPEIVRSLVELVLAPADGAAPGPAAALLLSRRFWITVSMAGVVPLAYLPTLDAMRYTSTVALMSVAYLWCIVFFHYVDPRTPRPPPEDVSYVNATVIVGAVSAAFFVYETVGCLGYLTFGDSIGVNILAIKGITVAIGRFSFVFLVLFSFPLQCHPCRFSLDKVLCSLSQIIARKYMHVFPTDDDDGDDPDEESLIEGAPSAQAADSAVNGCSEGATAVPRHSVNGGRAPGSSPVAAADNFPAAATAAATAAAARSRQKSKTGVPIPSAGRHAAITTAIVIGSYAVAMTVSSLDVVLSFVGATGSTTISFILPGLFYWRLHKDEPASRCPSKIAALALAAYGACVMVVCLGFNLGRPAGGGGAVGH
ncbi:MAG: transmembrane amino acid transporter protein-domain-containing protein [Olpidium bornovanus]|uniref:Transmembrane amino acid transporter protein-domain-containing protein n=1 Tax=Olpidium bornovanus TaxID=278681 RepID=A0A8H8A044_9FUNG|nr:MAG: transmembrane amino acid transporter protein-domain-containing protein [Olpidium bornovanus]